MNCRFCAKPANTVRTMLFARWGPSICDECIQVCNDIIQDDDRAYIPPSALPAPQELEDFIAALPQRPWAELLRIIDLAQRPTVSPITERLQCSFCRADGEAVSKLIAGPRVFICDRCVVRCNDALRSDDHGGLLEFPPSPFVGGAEAAPVRLSAAERAVVSARAGQELDRKYAAAWLALPACGGETEGAGALLVDGRERAPVALALSERRVDAAATFSDGWAPLCLTGESFMERGRFAQRIHERSRRAGGPFVWVDGRDPGSMVNMGNAKEGTVFVDHIDALTPDAQLLLGVTWFDRRKRALDVRVICGATDWRLVRSRIDKGTLSKRFMDNSIIWLPVAG